jgi:Cu/Ag efflux protein CusF
MTSHLLHAWRLAAGSVFSALLLVGAVSCSSSDKTAEASKATLDRQPSTPNAKEAAAADSGARTVAVVAGEAGGVVEETFTASATVRAVDNATRKVTLEAEDGEIATFTAPPEMRNLDQLHAGDRVKATGVSRLAIFVGRAGDRPDATHAAVLARAPKGAKPGAMVAETFEIVGKVRAIDTATRRATIAFPEGQVKTVPVRQDVDLARYKTGDNVVIRVTQQLNVLTETP